MENLLFIDIQASVSLKIHFISAHLEYSSDKRIDYMNNKKRAIIIIF